MRNTILLTILFLFEIFNISAKENCLSKNWKFFWEIYQKQNTWIMMILNGKILTYLTIGL